LTSDSIYNFIFIRFEENVERSNLLRHTRPAGHIFSGDVGLDTQTGEEAQTLLAIGEPGLVTSPLSFLNFPRALPWIY